MDFEYIFLSFETEKVSDVHLFATAVYFEVFLEVMLMRVMGEVITDSKSPNHNGDEIDEQQQN